MHGNLPKSAEFISPDRLDVSNEKKVRFTATARRESSLATRSRKESAADMISMFLSQ